MRLTFLILTLLSFSIGTAQNIDSDSIPTIPIDEKYLEDQLYVSFTYNLLADKPSDINQNGLSGGFGLGFIKDVPLNKERNFGFGLGIGYGLNILIQNLKITEANGTVNFEKAQDYFVNKITKQSIDIPFEIRWRTSDPVNYKFWRVYAGMTFSYVFDFKTKFRDENGTLRTSNIDEVEQFQYGLKLAAGRGTWNLYIYYALTDMFKEATFEGKPLNMYDVNIGLKFYIM